MPSGGNAGALAGRLDARFGEWDAGAGLAVLAREDCGDLPVGVMLRQAKDSSIVSSPNRRVSNVSLKCRSGARNSGNPTASGLPVPMAAAHGTDLERGRTRLKMLRA